MSELFTFRGTATGTGWMTLTSDIIRASVNVFRIPRGLKAKIWCKRLGLTSGSASISISFVPDVSSPTNNPLTTERLASPGELALEKRRPIVVRSLKGTEGIGIYVEAIDTGATVYGEIDIEVE
jgi:hypothetical protein